MILDAFAQFTGSTTATATATGNSDGTDSPSTGTEVSSQVVDLHASSTSMIPVLAANQGARDMGIGDDPALKLLVMVTVAFGGGTSLRVDLQGAPDNGSGAAGTFASFFTGIVVAEAALTAGAQLTPYDMPRPPQGVSIPRFLRLQYVTVGTHTSGKLRGNLVLDRIDQAFVGTDNSVLSGYPAGINIAN